MKYRIICHLIRVCTVCQDKNDLRAGDACLIPEIVIFVSNLMKESINAYRTEFSLVFQLVCSYMSFVVNWVIIIIGESF